MKKWIFATVLAAMLMTTAYAQTPAFPDAEGGGMWARGARGSDAPEIYHVTNLNDSGAGSFRDAVSKGNRFVVFDVGGNINITKRINITQDNITILGQTAPGEGISIDGEGIVITGDNIIMRYLRVRRGEGSSEGDTLWATRCRNIMIDHCSFAWSVDECVSFTYVENLTVQWSIIAEALTNSTHSKGTHGYGGIWGGVNTGGHHNLFSSNISRNPRIGAGARPEGNTPDTEGLVNVRNNVMYNWGSQSAYGGENGSRANFIGNYYKPGIASKRSDCFFSPTATTSDSTSLPENGGTTGGGVGRIGWSTTLYASGNVMEGNAGITEDNYKGIRPGSDVTDWIWCKDISDGIYVDGVLKANDEYLDEYPFITHDATAAYNEVLKYVGASLKRDAIDERIINNVINGTAPTGSVHGEGLVDTPDDVGGFATISGGAKERDTDNDGIVDSAEAKYGLNPELADSLTKADDGYTLLEKYAEELAVHEGMEKADKTALKERIYFAQRMDKYGYTKKSWNNMQSALEAAEEVAALVYAPQIDIDSAYYMIDNALSELELDEKYDLRVAIDEAMTIDSAKYTMDSYSALMKAIDAAQAVYNDAAYVQSEIDEAIAALESAIENLESEYKYYLDALIEDIYTLAQADYTYESMNRLVTVLRSAEAALENGDNAELERLYNELKAAYDSLEIAKTRTFSGDFEDFVSFKTVNDIYGDFTVGNGDGETEVTEGFGGNPTKAFVFRDNAATRIALTRKFGEKLSGAFFYEGDFYFENEVNTHNIILRLSDTESYFTLLMKKNASGATFRIQYFNEAIDFPATIVEADKWHHVSVLFDTESKRYCIWLNNQLIAEDILNEAGRELGITSYALATPGGSVQTMAVDNLKSAVLNGTGFINTVTEKSGDTVRFTGNIANYAEGKKAKAILASYADGRLVGVDCEEVELEADAVSEKIELITNQGETIKTFIWTDEMTPVK